MLCDDLANALENPRVKQTLLSLTRANPSLREQATEHLVTLRRRIHTSQRFVLSPLVIETANQLATDPEAVERSRDHLFFPANLTWIEWHGYVPWYPREGKMGLSFGGVGSNKEIHVGEVVLWLIPNEQATTELLPRSPTYFNIDLPGDGQMVEPISDEKPPLIYDIDVKRFAAWLGAVLALINTPRMCRTEAHEHSKLNKSRLKQNKPALLSWHEVNIRVDSGELGFSPERVGTGEHAFHHVRSHLRIRLGKVELVRPHWRGNRERGVIQQRHIVSRAEDEPGPWKGGPLPASKIIKSRFEGTD